MYLVPPRFAENRDRAGGVLVGHADVIEIAPILADARLSFLLAERG